MILVRNFHDYDIPFELNFFGKIHEPKLIKQSYTVSRTIGNRVKQRWINSYKTTTLEIIAIDEKNKDILENLFMTGVMCEMSDESLDIVSYGSIVGNSFVCEYFFDGEGNKLWRGSVEFED